ncbi:MAG: hypothetical protein JNK12_03630 [Acidimicrobiales bacterium]|nr:hypothetical protein [Acidimicrobiales bacterium]
MALLTRPIRRRLGRPTAVLVPLALAITVTIAATACHSDRGPSSGASDTTVTDASDAHRPLRSEAAPGRVPDPSVAPLSEGRGRAVGGLRFDVGAFGYEEGEFSFGGRARAIAAAGLPPAPYRSRMIVWTPRDPREFNGTTVVEWAQVSDVGDFELTVETNDEAAMLMEDGYAFAVVSAEQRGVCAPTADGCPGTSLVGADPERYGALRHPGDAYAFDIFDQAIEAIRFPTGVAPLGGLDTRLVIAQGFQRSVAKYFPHGTPDPPPADAPLGVHGPLNAYLASGSDDDARLVDAFLVDGAAPAGQPEGYRVPTLHHLDESAIEAEPTPDGPNHVTWEVVGAPHADRWSVDHVELPGPGPLAPRLSLPEEQARRARFDDFGVTEDPAGAVCAPGTARGTRFPRRYSLTAALAALRTWLETGVPAPAAPRVERADPLPDDAAQTLARDRDGTARGGLRLPIVTVPSSAYDGEACISSGTSALLPASRLASLYPSHRDYVRRLATATDRAVADGFLRCPDAEDILQVASASDVGGDDRFETAPACA